MIYSRCSRIHMTFAVAALEPRISRITTYGLAYTIGFVYTLVTALMVASCTSDTSWMHTPGVIVFCHAGGGADILITIGKCSLLSNLTYS